MTFSATYYHVWALYVCDFQVTKYLDFTVKTGLYTSVVVDFCVSINLSSPHSIISSIYLFLIEFNPHSYIFKYN